MSRVIEMKTADGFHFSGVGLERLEASEYTLVTLAVDSPYSVSAFKSEIERAVQAVVEACTDSPRGGNILLRLTQFNDWGVAEISGFAPPSEIGEVEIHPEGWTPLYDAIQDGLQSVMEYGKELDQKDFEVNAIVMVITDGLENNSRKATRKEIKKQVVEMRKEDALESFRAILVGVNPGEHNEELKDLAETLGLDQYVSVFDADRKSLMRLANFISRSIQAQSKALGSGGPSEPVGLLEV